MHKGFGLLSEVQCLLPPRAAQLWTPPSSSGLALLLPALSVKPGHSGLRLRQSLTALFHPSSGRYSGT